MEEMFKQEMIMCLPTMLNFPNAKTMDIYLVIVEGLRSLPWKKTSTSYTRKFGEENKNKKNR
jgi:hypothetical protein